MDTDRATSEERAIEQLVAMLQNGPPWRHPRGSAPDRAAVACAAAAALGHVGGEAALEALVESLSTNGGDARACVREEAARALAGFDSARTGTPLVAALKDRDSGVRRAAVISLRCSQNQNQRTAATLKLVAATDPNPGVRYQANWALAALGHGPGMAALAEPQSPEIER